MPNYEGERLRRLAEVVRAEREIAAETKTQYAKLLEAIHTEYLAEAVVAASAPPPGQQPAPQQGRQRINVLWLALGAYITAKAVKLFAKRFSLFSKDKSRLAIAEHKFLGGITEHLKGVPDEVYADLDRLVKDNASLPRPDLLKLLDAELTPGHAEYDARLDAVASRVSRTLAISAFNGGDQDGNVAAAQAAGRAMPTKRWLSSHDTKVRPTHAAADTDPENQEVPLDGFFTVGGFRALYPGDWTLPPQEAVNCRCTALYSTIGEPPVTDPITAAVEEAAPADEIAEDPYAGQLPDGWRGPVAALDVPTSDRRMLATPKNGIKTRAYPLTLTRNHVGDPTGYPTVGSVDNVWMQDGMLMGEGRFDLGGQDGQDAARQLAGGFLNRVSIDPVEVSAENYAYGADGVRLMLAEGDEMPEGAYTVTTFTDWTLAGLAMVPIPAYTQAAISPVYGYAPTLNAPDGAIVASVGGQVFTSKFFADPQLSEPTPLTVTDEGHVYGHVRLSGTCYQYGGGQGNGGFCLEPPSSDCGYAKFMVQGAKMDDGSIKAVGALTFGDGHESRGSLAASQAHYNDVATIAAKGIVGDDEFGVWFSGEVTDNARDKAYDLLLSPMSGHWEPDSDTGHLELMAIHIVVTPGYTVRRIVAGFDDAGQPNSLIITTFPQPVVAAIETPLPTKTTPRGDLLKAMADLKRGEELGLKIKMATEDARKRRAKRAEEKVAMAFAKVDPEERLKTYWAEGAGADKIQWGKDGDFNRCRVLINAAIAKKGGKPLPDHEISGLCEELHVRATGARPGQAPGEKKHSIVAAAIGSSDTAWDGGAAGGRVLDWATTDGKISVSKASQGFLAHVGDGSNRTDWKFPVADVHAGELTIIPRGVAAAASRVGSAKGIDKATVKGKIDSLYRQIHAHDNSWPASPDAS